jgi:polyhydroxybutyrate depolymerase
MSRTTWTAVIFGLCFAACGEAAMGDVDDVEDVAGDVQALDATAYADPVPSAGCASLRPDVGGYWPVNVAGRTRFFTVHIPPSYHRLLLRPTPLVLSFHGYRNFPLFQQVFSNLNDKADSAGFIAVYPLGTGNPLSFNGSGCCGEALTENVDDVAFTDAMLAALERSLCIDLRRVYASGFSNGGFMAQRLACERAERFGAVASVAGLIDPSACAPARPISVFEMHGTLDTIVPFAGQAGRYVSAPEAFRFWASEDACTDEASVSYQRGDVTCQTHAQCAGGSEVSFCTIDGGGHTWPGGLDNVLVEQVAGKVTHDLSANDALWSFFERHPLPRSSLVTP